MKKIIFFISLLLLSKTLFCADFKKMDIDEIYQLVDEGNIDVKDKNMMTSWCIPVITNIHINELPKERKDEYEFIIQMYNNQYKINNDFLNIFSYKTEIIYKERKIILIVRKEIIEEINLIVKPNTDVYIAAILGMSFELGKEIILFVTRIKNDKFD